MAPTSNASQGHDITSLGLLYFQSLQTMKNEQLFESVASWLTIPTNVSHCVLQLNLAPEKPSYGNLTNIVVVIQCSHKHLKRAVWISRRW